MSDTTETWGKYATHYRGLTCPECEHPVLDHQGRGGCAPLATRGLRVPMSQRLAHRAPGADRRHRSSER